MGLNRTATSTGSGTAGSASVGITPPNGRFCLIVFSYRANSLVSTQPVATIYNDNSGSNASLTQIAQVGNSSDTGLEVWSYIGDGNTDTIHLDLDQGDAFARIVVYEYDSNGTPWATWNPITTFGTAGNPNMSAFSPQVANGLQANELAFAVQTHMDGGSVGSTGAGSGWSNFDDWYDGGDRLLVEEIPTLNSAGIDAAFTTNGGGTGWLGAYFTVSDSPDCTVTIGGAVGGTLSQPAPTVSGGLTYAPGVISGLFDDPAPTTILDSAIAAAVLALTGSEPAPTILNDLVYGLSLPAAFTGHAVTPAFVTSVSTSIGVVTGTFTNFSSASPIQLTSGSAKTIRFDNTSFASIVILPPASEYLPGGPIFYLINASSGALTIKNYGSTVTVGTLAAGKVMLIFLKSPGTDADWLAAFQRTYNTARTPAVSRSTEPCGGVPDPDDTDLDPPSGALASGSSGPAPSGASLPVESGTFSGSSGASSGSSGSAPSSGSSSGSVPCGSCPARFKWYLDSDHFADDYFGDTGQLRHPEFGDSCAWEFYEQHPGDSPLGADDWFHTMYLNTGDNYWYYERIGYGNIDPYASTNTCGPTVWRKANVDGCPPTGTWAKYDSGDCGGTFPDMVVSNV